MSLVSVKLGRQEKLVFVAPPLIVTGVRKHVRTALVAVSVLVAFAAGGLLLHSSHARKALLRYQNELRARGEKLTYEELIAGRSPVLNASEWVVVNTSSELRGGKIPAASLELWKYVKPGRVQPIWNRENPFQPPDPKNGQRTWADLDSTADSFAGPLARIRKALKDPAPHSGQRLDLMPPVSSYLAMRTAGQALAAVLASDLHRGQLDSALEDAEAMANLARMNQQDFMLISQSFRLSLAGHGVAATWEALQAPGWSAPQLERLQQAWEKVQILPGMEKGFLGSRISILERVNGKRTSTSETGNIRAGPPMLAPAMLAEIPSAVTNALGLYIYRATSVDDDQLFLLRSIDDLIATLRLVQQGRSWKEASRTLDTRISELKNAPAFARHFRYVYSQSVPRFRQTVLRAVAIETERQLAITAMALKRFQLCYGHVPERLELLTPEFMATPTFDPFAGRALRYSPKSEGKFLLYSVGENGQDDNGSAGKGLDGPDVVWPEAVE